MGKEFLSHSSICVASLDSGFKKTALGSYILAFLTFSLEAKVLQNYLSHLHERTECSLACEENFSAQIQQNFPVCYELFNMGMTAAFVH